MSRRRPRRVLMTADCVGGVWTYALELVAGLAAHDVQATLFVSGGVPSPAKMRDAARLDNLTIVRSELKLEWMEGCETDIAETNRLLRDLEAEVRPDVVHVNGYANAAAGFSAPVVSVAHSCVETWWRAVKGQKAPDDWQDYRARILAGLASTSCLVAPTRAHLKAFCMAYGTPDATRVIHNGCAPHRFRPLRKAQRVLAAGRFWDEAKNLAVLQDVARCGVPITMAGDTGEAGPEGRAITWLGPLDASDLAKRMGESAVFVAPSLYEPFGLAVLEAALSGCALIVGDIPTMRELWDGAASFVDPRNPKMMAAAANGLLACPERGRQAGAVARERGKYYSRDAMTLRYLALYGELMAAGRPTARASAA